MMIDCGDDHDCGDDDDDEHQVAAVATICGLKR